MNKLTKIRPYVSVDIETTGIDDRSHILQISAVIDDGISPITELPKLDTVIKYKTITYSEPYALGMNADLFKRMMDKEFKTTEPLEAAQSFIEFLKIAQEWTGLDSKGKPSKVILSGKNLATFDLPKLRIFMSCYGLEREFDNLIHYKTLDVGSLYYDVFGDNVSLSEINKLTGRAPVNHNALDDALDVVYAVRHKLNKGI